MNSTMLDSKDVVNHRRLPRFNTLFSQVYAAEDDIDGQLKLAVLSENTAVNLIRVYVAEDDIDGQLKSAVLSKNSESAKNLMRQGANTSIQMDGLPLLHHLIMKKQEDILRCCIEHGADLNVLDRDRKPLLHFAVEKSNIDAMEVLLDYFDINKPDFEGFTPLFYAVILKNEEVFELLIRKGAAVNVQNSFGDTPLHVAACLSLSLWMVKELLQNGADVHLRNKDGDTALDVALQRSKRYWAPDSIFPIINELLDCGSVVDETNALVVNYLAYDINCEHKTLRRVLEETNGVNCQDAQKLTPLHHAVSNNRLDLAQLLLEKGAKIDARDCRGQTPLHFGVSHDCSPRMVVFLLGMGAEVSSHSSVYMVRKALTRKVRAYFLDFENDISAFLDAFTSKTNCITHFRCFAELIKYLPAIDCVNLYLAFK